MDDLSLLTALCLPAVLLACRALFLDALRGRPDALGWAVFNIFAIPLAIWGSFGWAALSLFALYAVAAVLYLFFIGA